jgi:4-hydroxy-3-methylbut-2-enyl diphosphate reductase
MAVAPESVHLIESTDDLDALDVGDAPVALLSQTTLSFDEWQHLRSSAVERFPDLWMPNRSDLCFATTNRQSALREIAAHADAVVVIGSANSSNTVALTEVARASGCGRVLRVNSAGELPDDLSGVVGVTAGASAPDSLVTAVIEALAPTQGVETVEVTEEDEYFPPPPELREMLRAVAMAVSVLCDTPASAGDPVADDRDVHAATVLTGV